MQPRVLDEEVVERREDEDARGAAEAGDRRQRGHHLAVLGWPDQVCAERGGEREREGLSEYEGGLSFVHVIF